MPDGMMDRIAELEALTAHLKTQVESLSQDLRAAKRELAEVDHRDREYALENIRVLKNGIDELKEAAEREVKIVSFVPESDGEPVGAAFRTNWWSGTRAAHRHARSLNYKTGFMIGEAPDGNTYLIACLK